MNPAGQARNRRNSLSSFRSHLLQEGACVLAPLLGWSLPTSRTAAHRGCIVCAGRPLLWCPAGTIENSPAFQRWVGRRKVASPEGTAEVQSHNQSFSRPFGTFLACAMFPGVKTPGYSQDVPRGQRNLVAAFSGKKATRFISDALKAISPLRCLATKMRVTITPTVSSEKNVEHVQLLGVRASVSSNPIFGDAGPNRRAEKTRHLASAASRFTGSGRVL